MGRIEIHIPPQENYGEISAARYIVNEMLRQSDMTLSAAIEKYNEVYHFNQTIQNISNKLTRNSMRMYELAQLASICNFRLYLVVYEKFRKKKKKEEYTLLEDEEKEGEQLSILISDETNQPKDGDNINDSIKPPKSETVKIKRKPDNQKTFSELLTDGYCEVESINFDSAIVAGARCEEAAAFIEENIRQYDYDETQEIILYLAAARQYQIKVKPIKNDGNIQML